MLCRWNVVDHGSTAVHLELLPMLLGFFTYKAGVVGRGAYELLSDAASPSSTSEDAATDVKGIGLLIAFCRPRGSASVSGAVQLW